MKIPVEKDWGDYKDDLDVHYAYRLYGGKNIDDAMEYFISNPIERASELRFAPFKIFQFYIHCFIQHLTSDKAADESDMASVFLRLVRDISEKFPSEAMSFYPKIENAVNYVAENQEYYGADYDIYGSFQEIRSEITKNLKMQEG